MSERYKLVFRGEVLEGQHRAVVRKRLAKLASFGERQLETLFSGQPVVLKRDADTATAARLQGLFKKAGARLRVAPVSAPAPAAPADASTPSAAAPAAPADAASAPAAGADDPFDLLPPGSPVLRDDERPEQAEVEVDVSHLTVQAADAAAATPPAAPGPAPSPDVSHLSLAETGADLGPAPGEAGSGNAAPPSPQPAPALELAEVGEDIDPRQPPPPPPAPDVSHLSLSPTGAPPSGDAPQADGGG